MKENKMGNIEFVDSNGKPIIKSSDNPFPESFYFDKLYEEAEYKKFIKNTERLIRPSKEYRTYIEQLRGTVSALNVDNILSYITSNDAELEFHHYPFSLYDIVDIVVFQNFFDMKDFTSFDISKEIMELHYENLIGLVPLSTTNHELAHAGELFLSSKQIFGDYKAFMARYPEGISADLREKITEMEEFSDKNKPTDAKGLL